MLDETRLRSHPELALLAALSAQLDLLHSILAAVHQPDRRDALADQARSIARVAQVLQDQVRAYNGIIEVGAHRRRSQHSR